MEAAALLRTLRPLRFGREREVEERSEDSWPSEWGEEDEHGVLSGY